MAKNFRLSKKILNKLKNKSEIQKALYFGVSPQEILEITLEQLFEFYLIAREWLEQKKVEEALDAFIFLVSLNSSHAEFWMGLGAALHLRHDYELAIDSYEMAAIYEIENPTPYFYLAKCLFAIHDRVSALQAIELAITYSEGKEDFQYIYDEARKAKEILQKSG